MWYEGSKVSPFPATVVEYLCVVVCLLRAVVNLPLTKPITDAPDVSDLKNGSSKTYTEAMKELKLHQQLLKPRGKSSQLQPALLTSSLEV